MIIISSNVSNRDVATIDAPGPEPGLSMCTDISGMEYVVDPDMTSFLEAIATLTF